MTIRAITRRIVLDHGLTTDNRARSWPCACTIHRIPDWFFASIPGSVHIHGGATPADHAGDSVASAERKGSNLGCDGDPAGRGFGHHPGTLDEHAVAIRALAGAASTATGRSKVCARRGGLRLFTGSSPVRPLRRQAAWHSGILRRRAFPPVRNPLRPPSRIRVCRPGD